MFRKKFSRRLKKHFDNCETLPLWNFFKVIEKADYKYLLITDNREDYKKIKLLSDTGYAEVWGKIVDEYTQLEKSSVFNTKLETKSKLIYRWSLYVEEQAMIKHLLIKTSIPYIQELTIRGYDIQIDNNEVYWKSLELASKRVHHHITHMESLSLKLGGESDDKDYSNPYDKIIAWLMSNGIPIDEGITVKRYEELKNIIREKLKAEKENYAAIKTRGR